MGWFLRLFLPICNKGVRIQSQRGLKEIYQPRSSIGLLGELGGVGNSWIVGDLRDVS